MSEVSRLLKELGMEALEGLWEDREFMRDILKGNGSEEARRLLELLEDAPPVRTLCYYLDFKDFVFAKPSDGMFNVVHYAEGGKQRVFSKIKSLSVEQIDGKLKIKLLYNGDDESDTEPAL